MPLSEAPQRGPERRPGGMVLVLNRCPLTVKHRARTDKRLNELMRQYALMQIRQSIACFIEHICQQRDFEATVID
jgi:hypothetical protein